MIFPRYRTYSAFRRVPCAEGSVPFEEWEARKQDAEERRLLYVAATRARDRLFLVEGAKGKGSVLGESLRTGLGGSVDGGPGVCPITGFAGTRRIFAGGGSALVAAVKEPPPVPPPPVAAPSDLFFGKTGSPPPPSPLLPVAEEVTLRDFHDEAAARRFGEKVHRALEAAPPIGAPWPPPGSPPVVWGEGEEARWRSLCAKIAASPFFRELSRAELVGTELSMLSFRGGWSKEERADLVVRFPGGSAEGRSGEPGEHWVVDYKTGPREREPEERNRKQVRGYAEILSGAWNVPVRGFLWYLETDETVEVGRRENPKRGEEE